MSHSSSQDWDQLKPRVYEVLHNTFGKPLCTGGPVNFNVCYTMTSCSPQSAKYAVLVHKLHAERAVTRSMLTRLGCCRIRSIQRGAGRRGQGYSVRYQGGAAAKQARPIQPVLSTCQTIGQIEGQVVGDQGAQRRAIGWIPVQALQVPASLCCCRSRLLGPDADWRWQVSVLCAAGGCAGWPCCCGLSTHW